jgi:hypothetical protein
MQNNRIWLGLGVVAALLAGVASASGVFMSDYVYARETQAWAAQGIGQDWATLLLVVPALVIASRLAARGSRRALAVWQGLLLYLIYSYVLYALFIHFNRLFLVYIGVLGFAFYAFVGSFTDAQHQAIDTARKFTFASAILFVCSIVFVALWLSELVPATLNGTAPQSLADVGLIVNPVHVLDLAIVLPALLITAILLHKHHALGVRLAAPLLTFLIAMGIAIEAMFLSTSRSGIPTPIEPAVLMGVVIVASVWACYTVLAAQEKGRRSHAEHHMFASIVPGG